MRVLVTGAAGFVGRHFCKYFLEKKYHVTGVDNIQKFTGAIHPKNGWPLFNPFDFTDVLTSLTSPDIGFILGIVIVPFVDKFSESPLDADEK